MSRQPSSFPIHTLDPTLSLAIIGGLFVIRARAVPQAEGVRNLLHRMKVARPAPWGAVHLYELEHVGLTSDLGDPTMERCVGQVFIEMTFPEAREGGLQVTYPLSFVPAD